MWDLIVSVPDHCLSFFFPKTIHTNMEAIMEKNNVEALMETSGINVKWVISSG